MILVVSSATDDHATAVIANLAARGTGTQLVDLSDFPTRASIALGYGEEGHRLVLTTPGGPPVDLAECRVAWWRRPQPFVLPDLAEPSMHAFTYNECHEAIAGLWEALDCTWVNEPKLDDAAAKKSFQLKVAVELGIPIPRTLITNDPGEALAFASAVGVDSTVYKAFSATEEHWRETRILRVEELALLDHVRVAPVIFQEYVPASLDLRITVMGDDVFPAAVHSQATDYTTDYRIRMDDTPIEPYDLPDDVEASLHRLMKRLGLVYGAIDMRRTPDGDHVFLEVNPAGQWRFIEERTGQPMTDAFAGLLARLDR